jgi:Flp pilus assembly protein TadD
VLHQRLLRSEPNNALAHYHLGFAYGMSGRDSEELAEYLKAASLGLKNWDLFLNLGLAYLGEHELAAAANALEMAVLLGPAHAEAHFNLAIIYEREKRWRDALREITVARRLAPEDPDVENENAIICVETGDFVGAKDIWTSLAELVPGYAPARANLSTLNRSFRSNGQLGWRTEISDSRADGDSDQSGNRALSNLQTATEVSGR